jgi:hypothetical protein
MLNGELDAPLFKAAKMMDEERIEGGKRGKRFGKKQ